MASACFCIKLTLNCSDSPSISFNMTLVGNLYGEAFYLGSYDGKTYAFYYLGGQWRFVNISNPTTSIFFAISNVATPCDVLSSLWQLGDLTNFTYCSDDIFDDPILTIEEDFPNCNLFPGDCSCKILKNTIKCDVFYQTCEGNIVQQSIDANTEIIGCFKGTPIFFSQGAGYPWGTVQNYTLSNCGNFCITGTSACCLQIKIGYGPSTQITNINPVGTINGLPIYNFISNDLTNEYNTIIYFDSNTNLWNFDIQEDNSFQTIATLNTGSCPSGEWVIDIPGFSKTIETTQVTCQYPSPTPTPTPTMTPAPPIVPIPPCLQGTNECSVVTIFPMSVFCKVKQPSDPKSSDGTASLIITGGTPPYTVLWDNLNIGQTIYNLNFGTYTATVIDNYGDFTAKTTCVLVPPSPTPTTTPTPTPTTPYIEYQICFNLSQFYVTFNPNGIKNGRPNWTGTTGGQDYEIVWSASTNQWVLNPSPIPGALIVNNNTSYPPLNNWVVLGAPIPPPRLYTGSCTPPPVGLFGIESIVIPETTPISLEVSKNDPSCNCDGNLTLIGNGGVPPYSYSINGGITYRNIPIFDNLCSGIYSPTIMDSNGNVTTTNITLNPPSNPIIYTVTLNTTSNIQQTTGTLLTKEYTTLVNVTPPLEDGVMLTFDLSHTNIFKTSPNTGSTTNITSSILYKNGLVESVTLTGTTEGTTFNTFAGCQGNIINIKSTNDSWQSLQITNSDTILLVTTTTIIQNEVINCYVGTSDETFSITNVTLQGCGCCNVISG